MKMPKNALIFIPTFDKGRMCLICSIAVFSHLISSSCSYNRTPSEPILKYSTPEYDKVKVYVTKDSVKFKLHHNTYNSIKSFNLFTQNDVEYISFFDELSNSINIYSFHSKQLYKRTQIQNWLKNTRLYKTTVFVKNFDSIFITNEKKIYLFDSSGRIINILEYLKEPDNLFAVFENKNKPIFYSTFLYLATRPYVKNNSRKDLYNWKPLYRFDLANGNSILFGNLPTIYRENYLSQFLIDYNFCYNDRGNFILNFSADSNIYETNLSDTYIAYYAKSKFQTSTITPLRSSNFTPEDEFKQYKTNDCYGALFFDPNRKRYLRLAKKGINIDALQSRAPERKESIIVFDENLKIIGESEIDNSISFSSLFFAKNRNMYVRTNLKDEYTLTFVRLAYSEEDAIKYAEVTYDNSSQTLK